jgi:hypothetical protein
MFELCEGIPIKIMAQEPLKVKDYKEIKNKGNYSGR